MQAEIDAALSAHCLDAAQVEALRDKLQSVVGALEDKLQVLKRRDKTAEFLATLDDVERRMKLPADDADHLEYFFLPADWDEHISGDDLERRFFYENDYVTFTDMDFHYTFDEDGDIDATHYESWGSFQQPECWERDLFEQFCRQELDVSEFDVEQIGEPFTWSSSGDRAGQVDGRVSLYHIRLPRPGETASTREEEDDDEDSDADAGT